VEFLNIASLVVQIILAVVGIWYASETRMLRVQDKTKMQQLEVQLDVMRKQDLHSIQPLCIPVLYSDVPVNMINVIGSTYAIGIINANPNVALDVMACGYDPVDKNFFKTFGVGSVKPCLKSKSSNLPGLVKMCASD